MISNSSLVSMVAGPSSPSLNDFRRHSMASGRAMMHTFFLRTKKLKKVGNSISAKFTNVRLSKRCCGTTKNVGTVSPMLMWSLMVSGGAPTCTVPAGVSTVYPPRGSRDTCSCSRAIFSAGDDMGDGGPVVAPLDVGSIDSLLADRARASLNRSTLSLYMRVSDTSASVADSRDPAPAPPPAPALAPFAGLELGDGSTGGVGVPADADPRRGAFGGFVGEAAAPVAASRPLEAIVGGSRAPGALDPLVTRCAVPGGPQPADHDQWAMWYVRLSHCCAAALSRNSRVAGAPALLQPVWYTVRPHVRYNVT